MLEKLTVSYMYFLFGMASGILSSYLSDARPDINFNAFLMMSTVVFFLVFGTASWISAVINDKLQ